MAGPPPARATLEQPGQDRAPKNEACRTPPNVSFAVSTALYCSCDQYSFGGSSPVDGEWPIEFSRKANNVEARIRRRFRCGRGGWLDQRGRSPHGAFEIGRERALGRARTKSRRGTSAADDAQAFDHRGRERFLRAR